MRIFFRILSPFLFCALFSNISFAQRNPADTALDKVEVEASFPGGLTAWSKYITKQIMQNADQFTRKDYGTCIVRFIVDTLGSVRDVEAMSMKRSRLAKIAIHAIENGPKWVPAQQNGRYVNAYRLQPVTVSAPGK
ncbi:MAG: energy transducer TonB [Ginsengibacter sp.]